MMTAVVDEQACIAAGFSFGDVRVVRRLDGDDGDDGYRSELGQPLSRSLAMTKGGTAFGWGRPILRRRHVKLGVGPFKEAWLTYILRRHHRQRPRQHQHDIQDIVCLHNIITTSPSSPLDIDRPHLPIPSARTSPHPRNTPSKPRESLPLAIRLGGPRISVGDGDDDDGFGCFTTSPIRCCLTVIVDLVHYDDHSYVLPTRQRGRFFVDWLRPAKVEVLSGEEEGEGTEREAGSSAVGAR
jgi:hypothetical protein